MPSTPDLERPPNGVSTSHSGQHPSMRSAMSKSFTTAFQTGHLVLGQSP
ncbi:hypothetical protein [Halogeometricum borinquense]|uniref:Uncharacterized protein n=1 Tax=Halogeometricum borinquense (strain ATCC 700274 / DSM 11551 / JCM 10706 / KCTC 4070 / PR3) TaxID=469382 RepID=E4NW07_HALBP|nr:hypothetical protein [Halogeometricum borinquense]ADQ69227.1 hypothetical protein Hbor_39130 [Halogeometricum borinquense DSM 11551]